jgi:hypothetical protein
MITTITITITAMNIIMIMTTSMTIITGIIMLPWRISTV